MSELPHKHRSKATQRPDGPRWRVVMHDIIFESDTRAGWVFDVALLIAILLSIMTVALETLPGFNNNQVLYGLEWVLTILFTIEYLCRIACARHPLRYAISFWGIIDLLSILPTFLGLFFADRSAASFVILRSIRLLRVFRVLKLWRMMDDAEELSQAIWKTRHKIIVFLMVVMVAVTISGTLMFFIEHELALFLAGDDEDLIQKAQDSPFESIPQSMYWAIVTMTTVGYGDIVPQTTTGKIIAATLILLGYSLIIVPSGFVTAELTSRDRDDADSADDQPVPLHCPRCDTSGHIDQAVYCYRCGERLQGQTAA